MLHARFTTTEGSFRIRLFDAEVPNTVANFVGLAEGTKEFVDPKTGQTTGMSLSQWAQTLRTDPTYDYDSTDGAMAVAHDLTNKIAQAFGYRAA